MSDDEITVTPPPHETLQTLYSENVLKKAGDLVQDSKAEDGLITEDEISPNTWWVKGSGTRVYRVDRVGVTFDGETEDGFSGIPWMTCECPNGAARGGRPSCYHTAAVLLLLEETAEREAEAKADFYSYPREVDDA